MEVFEAVRTVLAVREFQDKPVPPDAARRIGEAAHLTGSASNRQPWHFTRLRRTAIRCSPAIMSVYEIHGDPRTGGRRRVLGNLPRHTGMCLPGGLVR